MKLELGEAIRLGSMASEKTKFIRHDAGRSCAIGAAEIAVGIVAETYWPEILLPCQHPVTGKSLPLVSIIASLNNGYVWPHCNNGSGLCFPEWTREEIADWVETLERPSQPTIDQPAEQPVDGSVEQPIEQLVEV